MNRRVIFSSALGNNTDGLPFTVLFDASGQILGQVEGEVLGRVLARYG